MSDCQASGKNSNTTFIVPDPVFFEILRYHNISMI